MKTTRHYSKLLMLIVFAASFSLGAIQTANAETTQSNRNTPAIEAGASLLGQPQIQRTDTLKLPSRELPTFKVHAKPQRSRGILNVLGGRFVDEDRHPSFRQSTFPQKY